jgi:hypothetical protein
MKEIIFVIYKEREREREREKERKTTMRRIEF